MDKPVAEVIGQDGNVFSVLSICCKALKKAGQNDRAKELQERVFDADSYAHALNIMQEYVDMK